MTLTVSVKNDFLSTLCKLKIIFFFNLSNNKVGRDQLTGTH